MVSADMSKIQQVLYNLIDNAIKFSNSDSSIIISVTERVIKPLFLSRTSALVFQGKAYPKYGSVSIKPMFQEARTRPEPALVFP